MSEANRQSTAMWPIQFIFVLVVSLGPAFAQVRAGKTAKVLLLTGEDYAGHHWKETTPALKKALQQDARLVVDVRDDLDFLRNGDLSQYDAIVMHFKNYDPKNPGRAAYDRLERFVREGGGLVLVHFACGAFQEFQDDFVHIAGRVWFGMPAPEGHRQHDPYGRFTVTVATSNHPICRGMKDFETTDELYTCLKGEVPITVLATAVSKGNGKTYPMAFVLQPDNGRVFHCVLGHDRHALSVAGTAQLYRRGTAWAAGLEPR